MRFAFKKSKKSYQGKGDMADIKEKIREAEERLARINMKIGQYSDKLESLRSAKSSIEARLEDWKSKL